MTGIVEDTVAEDGDMLGAPAWSVGFSILSPSIASDPEAFVLGLVARPGELGFSTPSGTLDESPEYSGFICRSAVADMCLWTRSAALEKCIETS